MQTILYLLRKEFIQIRRQPILIGLLFLMPMVQLIILAYAADFEVKNVRICIVDQDLSSASRILLGKFEASPNFLVSGTSTRRAAGLEQIQKREADLALVIPQGFERELLRERVGKLQLQVNAINGTKALLGSAYAESIIQSFLAEYRITYEPAAFTAGQPGLKVTFSNWYNPDLEYHNFMVPGILVMLVTLVGMFMSGLNIVREKEMGTMEQINVTPIRKYQFVVGKLSPFWIIGMLELAFGLLIAKVIFQIPMVGSLGLVVGYAALYLLAVLGIGLFISTVSETQQQAMFLAWFFVVIFVLMSGLFTPIESMPEWAQVVTWFNPIAYFVEVNRLVLLKGAGFTAIQSHFWKTGLFAAATLTLAILNYRKTSG